MDNSQPESGDRDPILPSTCSSKPSAKSPPAEIRDLVARLSLRYPPTNQADLQSRAGLLALLAEDLADMPPHLLEKAIALHVRATPYMPKASDLIHYAKNILEGERPKGPTNYRQMAAERNARMDADPKERQDIRWEANDHSYWLVPRDQLGKPEEPRCTPEQAAAIMAEFKIKSSILDPIANALKPARRNPTEADIADLKREMGILPPPNEQAA